MYARVVSARVAPERLDDLVRVLRDEVVPNAAEQPGFEGAFTLTDAGTGINNVSSSAPSPSLAIRTASERTHWVVQSSSAIGRPSGRNQLTS